MQLREVLVETSTGRVLSTGCVDWTTNSHYDPSIHTVIKDNVFTFDPSLYNPDTKTKTAWYWDGSTFTQTAP